MLGSLPNSSREAAKLSVPPPEKRIEPKRYIYPLAYKRDPFIPLIGEMVSGTTTRVSLTDKKGEFIRLELKGIIKDKKGKIALISSSHGESYTLKAGRIYDRRNQIISGVSGIIKEGSVVLFSPNRTIIELPLLRKEGVPTKYGS